MIDGWSISYKIAFTKLPSDQCHWNFTENKPSIGSGALDDLVFILYCRVIGQWLPTCRRSIGNQLAISWGAIGNRLAIGRRLVGYCILSVCLWLQKVCNFLEIGRQPIGDWSAISRQLKIVSGLSATAATSRRSFANQWATCRQPVGDHQKPFYDWFGRREVSLAATKTSLRPNRPCNRSATSRRHPCNHPATSLRPLEIVVARRSPTGCKLCVTGALEGVSRVKFITKF